MAHTHSESAKRLFDIILRLDTKEECIAFFEDLCTVRELEDMAQRLDAAFLLESGMNYQEIAIELNRTPKSIDNALQRIKRKLDTFENN